MDRSPLDVAGVRWWLGPGVDAGRGRHLTERALSALAAGAPNLKVGRRKQLYLLALEGSRPDHLLKVNRYDEGVARLRRIRAGKARQELQRARDAADRGIPTPIPVAAGEARRRGLLQRCYLLVPYLEDASDLRLVWREGRGSARERRLWATALGELSRRIHDAGLLQEDFAPNNFLLRPGEPPELFAIDFERARLVPHLREEARRFMLARLDRHLTGASAGQRMRFLHAYAEGDRGEARRWWRLVETYLPTLARQSLRHWLDTATGAGRRFAPVERDGWSGWSRRRAPLEAVLEAAERAPAEVASRQDGALFVRSLGALSQRSAARTWATAQILWQRGETCPEPFALLRRGSAGVLIFERRARARLLRELPDATQARAAVAVLLDRLLALGADPGSIAADAIAIEETHAGRRARWLDPRGFHPQRVPRHDYHARARELARLLTTRERFGP